MRTQTLLAALAASGALAGCRWTDFDDLADLTWVRSLDEPDVGATDFAVAIAGVSSSASGGSLAVLSDGVSTYSLVTFDAAGGARYASSPAPLKLTSKQIGALPAHPAFAADASSHVGLAEPSLGGAGFALVVGPATAPAGVEVASDVTPTPQPEAAVFTDSHFVFSAGDSIYTVPLDGGAAARCALQRDATAMTAVTAAALAWSGTALWVWSHEGELLSFALPCADAPLVATTAYPVGTGFAPDAGSRLHLAGERAVLVGVPATPDAGQVFVIDTRTGAPLGTPLAVEGLRSSLLVETGSVRYLALGIPDRVVDGVAAGEVDLYELPSSGGLAASPVESLHDAQPEAGQTFGRALATMSFNGEAVLVVGARREIFAYYRTALYDHRP